jgi:hypothetical protein
MGSSTRHGRWAGLTGALVLVCGCASSDARTADVGGPMVPVPPSVQGTMPVMTGAPGQPAAHPVGQSSGQSGSGSGSGLTFQPTRVGESCTIDGAIGNGGGGPVICDGTWRYLMSDDVPAAPTGGYQARPDWYPTLAQIFNRPDATCPPSEVEFTTSVLPVESIVASVPYGLMIGDHVTPIDHGYLGIASLAKDPATLTDADYVPVTSPADGTIIEVSSLGSPTSHRVVIDHGCNVFTVYMVVNRLAGVLESYADQVDSGGYVRVELPVHAGDVFGEQRDNPMDFNVFAGTTWLNGFAQPMSYAYGETWKPYTTDPLPFFSADLRPTYERAMQRTVEPRWGKIDHDVIGAAAGNWFLEGTIGYNGQQIDDVRSATTEIQGGPVPGKNGYSWSHLSFAPHWVVPDQWIASFGIWTDPNGDFRQFLIDVQSGQPTPDQLTASSGVVVYRLTDWQVLDASGAPFAHQNRMPEPVGYTIAPAQVQGLVAVQVNDDGTITVETMAGVEDATAFAGFTDASRTYHR